MWCSLQYTAPSCLPCVLSLQIHLVKDTWLSSEQIFEVMITWSRGVGGTSETQVWRTNLKSKLIFEGTTYICKSYLDLLVRFHKSYCSRERKSCKHRSNSPKFSRSVFLYVTHQIFSIGIPAAFTPQISSKITKSWLSRFQNTLFHEQMETRTMKKILMTSRQTST